MILDRVYTIIRRESKPLAEHLAERAAHLHGRSLAAHDHAGPERKQSRAELHAENAPPAKWTDAVERPFDLLNATTARFGSEAAVHDDRDPANVRVPRPACYSQERHQDDSLQGEVKGRSRRDIPTKLDFDRFRIAVGSRARVEESDIGSV